MTKKIKQPVADNRRDVDLIREALTYFAGGKPEDFTPGQLAPLAFAALERLEEALRETLWLATTHTSQTDEIATAILLRARVVLAGVAA